jgi:uncharacterized protein YndB with AHSA1/START domain
MRVVLEAMWAATLDQRYTLAGGAATRRSTRISSSVTASRPPSVRSSRRPPLTDASRWNRWQGVGGAIKAAPGGELRIEMGDGSLACGQFTELVPDRRVVFTWGWNDGAYGLAPGSSVVQIDLVPDGDGTLIRLFHRGLPGPAREPHHAGWSMYLERLGVCARGGDPGPVPRS